MKGMVDISKKEVVFRRAVAEGIIELRKETIERIKRGEVEKGDVFEIAKIGALIGVKMSTQIMPFCHPIPIEDVKVDFEVGDNFIKVRVEVKTHAKTGVEMDALSGVMGALLNIWDVVKKYEKDDKGQYPYTKIKDVRVVEKEKRPHA